MPNTTRDDVELEKLRDAVDKIIDETTRVSQMSQWLQVIAASFATLALVVLVKHFL